MDGSTEPSSNVTTMDTGSGGSKKKNTNGTLKEPNKHNGVLTKSVNDIDNNENANSTQTTSTGTTSLASSSSPLNGSAITEYNRRVTGNVQQHNSAIIERCVNVDTIVKSHNNCTNNNNDNGKTSSDNGKYVIGIPLPSPPGCGCVIRAPSPEPDEITISITPTTGGQFELTVERNETVENLKKIISKRLKVAKDRICLLHRERQLREGTLKQNRLQHGSRLTLLPNVETGLMGQRPEQSVMQALESLNDSQVNDFLSGKAPLNLTMRLGDQMMLIQLQLSTVTPATPSTTTNNNNTSSNSGSQSCPPVASASVDGLRIGSQNVTTTNNSTNTGTTTTSMESSSSCQTNQGTTNSSSSSSPNNPNNTSSTASSSTTRSVSPRSWAKLAARALRSYSSLMSNLASGCQAPAGCPNNNSSSSTSNSTNLTTATTTTNPCQTAERTTNSPTSPPNSPTYSPSVTSSSRLSRFYRQWDVQNSSTSSSSTSTSSASSTSSTTTANSPSSNTSRVNYRNKIAGIPYIFQRQHHRQHHRHYYHHHHHHHHHHSRNKHLPAGTKSSSSSSSSSSSNCETVQEQDSPIGTSETEIPDEPMATVPSLPCTPQKKEVCNGHHHHHHHHHHSQQQNSPTTTSHQHDINVGSPDSPSSPQSPNASVIGNSSKVSATLDTRALVEASRNLTQKLKQLSSEVLTSRVDLAEEHAKRRQGAIIESMHHHGKGVYSGTFSGTLNPALQDRHGRPKRDISTIIHILNDLLCATPATTAGGPYRHHHRHISGRLQSSSSAPGTSEVSSGNGPGSTGNNGGSYNDEELSKENEATKGKMRRLRLVMEQRRAKRKARRQARAAPYTTQWAALTPDPGSNHDPNTSTSASSGGPNGNTTESQNEPELQPCSPEPVVA